MSLLSCYVAREPVLAPRKTHVPVVLMYLLFPCFGDLCTLRKCPQTAGDIHWGLRDLLAVPKTFQADFRDIPNRFQGCFGLISGIF